MRADTRTDHDPRYPIGPFAAPAEVRDGDRTEAIQVLAEMPEQLREAVRGFTEEQFDTPYREGGWTVRQLIHHIADSHSIAFDRMRRALTEDWPEVRGYNEKGFAQLADARAPAEWSLELVESLHARWVMVLGALTADQWKRGFRHNERGPMPLEKVVLLYAWHARHHVAHITHLRTQLGW